MAEPPIAYICIPRTGSRSVRAGIEQTYRLKHRHPVKLVSVDFSAVVAGMPPLTRIIYGHMPYGLHQVTPVRYATALREPISRVVSHVRLRRFKRQLVGKRLLPPGNFIRSQNGTNLQVRVISGLWEVPEVTADMLELAKKNLETIEILDFCESGLKAFAKRLGVKGELPHIRDEVEPAPIADEDMRLIHEVNTYDLRFYDWALAHASARKASAVPAPAALGPVKADASNAASLPADGTPSAHGASSALHEPGGPGMSWKTSYRSIYYADAPEPPDLVLHPKETALLVIDVQNTYRKRPDRASLPPGKQAHFDLWTPFYERLEQKVIPNTADLLRTFRARGIECLFARIASHTRHGRERSLSHRKPGWNDLLLPKDDWDSQIVDELAPVGEEIVVHKMTDSALAGSNLRLLLHNLGIRNVICTGVFTDQCVSSTVRSLADESYNVVVLEDCCAAGSDELHHKELEIINMIYCQVMSAAELKALMKLN